MNRDRDENFKNQSKDRLKKSITQKIKTTMIGSIHAIERHFGFLFGQEGEDRIDESLLTEQQKQLYSIFLELRKDILDLGNKQINNAVNEIDQYTITWNRFTLSLPVITRKDGQ